MVIRFRLWQWVTHNYMMDLSLNPFIFHHSTFAILLKVMLTITIFFVNYSMICRILKLLLCP